MNTNDTIAAIATPPGRGGIGVIRISGADSHTIANALTQIEPRARHAHLARFTDADGNTIDEGLLLSFPAPHSFTGEDTIELHTHGSPVVLDLLMQRVGELGARVAEPGEFTRRAFCNNKIDLAQAEAVSDLIASSAAQSARSALRVLSGEFSAKVEELRKTLTALRARAESSIDFSDDNNDAVEDTVDADALRADLTALDARITDLLRNGEHGALLASGAHIAIIGRPNVGKSSVLNRLSKQNEAIVSETPGTTRDIVKCDVLISGIPVRVLDTAGLRTTDEATEAEGIRRARLAMERADLVLIVFDATQTETNEEQVWRDELQAQGQKVVAIANKTDLLNKQPEHFPLDAFGVSAKTGARFDLMEKHIAHALGYKEAADDSPDDSWAAQRRHLNALRDAREAIRRAMNNAHDRHIELFAEDLANAHRALGELVGEFTNEDLLGEIFSRFCIGK